jgi:translation elongation factor P/translation initiation factor 5A
MKANKDIIQRLMENNALKVVSINISNMTYTCNDGNDYPLMDGLQNLSIDELQKHIDKAKETTINILKQIEEDNG